MRKYITDIKKNIYLKESSITAKKFKSKDNVIKINLDKSITKYLGMGSALTESSAYNYSLLDKNNKDNFIKDCFSEKGLNYNYARICIGSSDYSLRFYSYARKKDLTDFNINHDYNYIIPFIKDILKIKNINIIASPWSPPVMYKNIKLFRYGFKLSKKYYDNYSNYLIKFLKAYHNIGINVKYITMQNEPFARQRWESCKFSIEEQKCFIYNYLLPKLTDTKLLLHDHNKDNLYNIIKSLYKKNDKVAGASFHNYSGSHFNELMSIRKEYPSLLLINTEGCTEYSKYDELSWIKDAEYYLNDIIGDFNNGVNAYLDWNILLNEMGGPSHIKNPVKSALILKNDSYIRTPIYYYIYHISHFVVENMDILENNSYTNNLDIVAFKDKNKLIIVIMNKNDEFYSYNLVIKNKYITDKINAHNIITYVCNLDEFVI